MKKRILIVDDSEDMRVLLAQILEEEGENYDVLFAEDGEQALAEAEREQPDLILLDMSLPGMSGWDVAARLRSNPAFAAIPILAVTAHVLEADQQRALALGCNAHLGKPFDVSTLLDTIEALL
jgi:two-component system cell cycle response regulator DivK